MDQWGLIFQPEKSVSQRLVLPRTVTRSRAAHSLFPVLWHTTRGFPTRARRCGWPSPAGAHGSDSEHRFLSTLGAGTFGWPSSLKGCRGKFWKRGTVLQVAGPWWRAIAATFAWVAHATAPDAHRPGCGRPDAAATARVRRSQPLWEPAGHPGRREATRGEGGHCLPHGPAHDAALRSATPVATGDSSAPPPNGRRGPNSSLRPPGSDNSQRSKENDTPFTSTTPSPRLGPRLRVLPTHSRRLGLPVGSCPPQALRTHSYCQPLPHLCPAAPLGAQTAVSAPALGGGGVSQAAAERATHARTGNPNAHPERCKGKQFSVRHQTLLV